jgi:hypothetical protein
MVLPFFYGINALIAPLTFIVLAEKSANYASKPETETVVSDKPCAE